MRKGILISLLIIVVLGCMSETTCNPQTAENRRTEGSSTNLSRGIGCLVAQNWIKVDLQEMGLRVGGTAQARFQIGSIPGISPESPATTNVLLLSPRGSGGWLLFFRTQSDGTAIAIRNGYRVKRIDGAWSASEGNGGITTYKAMGDFVTKLVKRPPILVQLTPIAEGCRFSE